MISRLVLGTVTWNGRREVRRDHLRAFMALKPPVVGLTLDRVIVDNSARFNPGKEWEPLLREFDPEGTVEVLHDPMPDAPPGFRVAHSYNVLAGIAIGRRAVGLFSVEADVIPPENALISMVPRGSVVAAPVPYLDGGSLISRKLEPGSPQDIPTVRGKDVAMTALGVPGTVAAPNMMFRHEYYRLRDLPARDEAVRVAGVHLGCTWIDSGVLPKVRFRVEAGQLAFGPDTWFSWDARHAGFALLADLNIRPEHRFRESECWADRGVDPRWKAP